jgi:hypothetical protein
MSYKPIHNYRHKDKLPPDDPDKIIYGSHLSDDFESIARAIGRVQSEIDQIEAPDLSGYVEEAPQNGTIYGRANAQWVPVSSGGGGTGGHLVFWDELLEKPEGISTLGYENTVDGGTYRRSIK